MWISIHALREEGDRDDIERLIRREGFQSTPSARRATCLIYKQYSLISDFNPRPPRGGRLSDTVSGAAFLGISIHALREEGDQQEPERTRAFL